MILIIYQSWFATGHRRCQWFDESKFCSSPKNEIFFELLLATK